MPKLVTDEGLLSLRTYVDSHALDVGGALSDMRLLLDDGYPQFVRHRSRSIPPQNARLAGSIPEAASDYFSAKIGRGMAPPTPGLPSQPSVKLVLAAGFIG
jgi:hypothetical protein